MEQEIRIAVRSLVEFILRSGDIDNRRGTMADKDAMQMGSRLHRKIQGRMGAAYQAEVYLSDTFSCGAFSLTVEGRADGIIREGEGTVVDEIKGVLRELEICGRAGARTFGPGKMLRLSVRQKTGGLKRWACR